AGRPLGAEITFDTDPKAAEPPRWYEIVGVVGDIRQTPSQTEQPPEVFIPYHDTFWPLSVFVVRANGDPRGLTAAARRAIASVDPNQVVDAIGPLEEDLVAVTSDSWTRAVMVGLFALTALALAAVGLYGVLASEVAQRQQEIGVRLALGAEPARVLRMVVGGGLGVALVGLGLGALGAAALGSVLASQLYGVRATDLASFVGAGVALLVVAALASYVPARRAARLDPMTALRRE
ncbi:MAG: FtsX-like permease family protein, partial [Gemmatimonadota bacterium]